MLQIAQHVDDLARAVDFYTVLLERPPLVVTETQAFFDLGEARLLLDGEAPSSMFWVEVENVHETLERLTGLVDVVAAPALVRTHDDNALGPEGREQWQALVRDSEGNTVGMLAFQKA